MVEHPFINKKNITIKNNDGDNIVINCEYAKTPNEQMTGVLGMDDMCDNCGILFKVKPTSYYHMKGVKFPIDMVFCNSKGKILSIITAHPDGDNVYPPNGSHYNIEVNAGFCDEHNVKKGNNIYIS